MPRTTLTIEGLPDGDEANTVTVKYTKPVENSSAWLTDTFTVIDEYVDAASEPIVSTALDLPGVYRISEASNKAILKLRRANNRQRISFVTVDEGIMFQPADVLEINDTNRGITGLQIFVESAVMIDYGRWRITGIRYRDSDYSDECYLEGGKWVDPLGLPVVYVDCLEYDCEAYAQSVSGLDINLALYNGSDALGSPFWEWPFAKDTTEDNANMYWRGNFIAAAVTIFDWSTKSTAEGSGIRPCNVSAWSQNAGPTFCDAADLAVMYRGTTSYPTVLLPPQDLWSLQSDYTFATIVSTYNGGSSCFVEIWRNSGKRWTVLGSTSNAAFDVTCRLSISNASPGHTLTLILGAGSPGELIVTQDIPNLQGTWMHITSTITNGDPVLEGNGYRFPVSATVRATVASTGETYVLSGTGSEYQSAIGTVTGVQARTHTQYTCPNFFYSAGNTDNRITMSYVSFNNSGGGTDSEAYGEAFLRNFEDYVDPNCA